MQNITTFNLDLLAPFEKIYVLVSGGMDSTYLYLMIKEKFPGRVYPVNCYNPYENNRTLKQIKKSDPNFIEVRPDEKYKPKDVIRKAFLEIPHAMELREKKKYSKKVFGCCRVFKHDMFKKDPRFKQDKSVVISGIKFGDGNQRRLFLYQLRAGKETIGSSFTKNNYYGKAVSTFFHKHKWGATYCYPFRDYKYQELPKEILDQLKEIYPYINHTGCSICPVLLVFEKRISRHGSKLDLERIERSKIFYQRLKGEKISKQKKLL